MKYQDVGLQAAYEQGWRQAQEIWGEFFDTPDRVVGIIQSTRTWRDRYERLSHDADCLPDHRRDCAEKAAHCDGWLSAWGWPWNT